MKLKLYSGLSNVQFNKKELISYPNTYISTTYIKDIALIFTENNGMIIELTEDVCDEFVCCSVEWISKFKDECEILLARSIPYAHKSRGVDLGQHCLLSLKDKIMCNNGTLDVVSLSTVNTSNTGIIGKHLKNDKLVEKFSDICEQYLFEPNGLYQIHQSFGNHKNYSDFCAGEKKMKKNKAFPQAKRKINREWGDNDHFFMHLSEIVTIALSDREIKRLFELICIHVMGSTDIVANRQMFKVLVEFSKDFKQI